LAGFIDIKHERLKINMKKPPSMRNKKRYIFFKIISDEKVNFNEVKNAVWNSVLNWMGESNAAKADIAFIRNLWDSKQGICVIRCVPKYVDDVKMSLALVHQIGEARVILQTLLVSGTIKSAKKKLKNKIGLSV